jgi:hypothetical protein
MGEEGAPSTGTDTRSQGAEKHPVAPDHSKKRPRSSEATGAPENPTSKHRRIIQDWSDEEEEENLTADMLNPCQRKDVERMVLEGQSRPVATPARGMPTTSTAATSHVPPPSDGGQGSSGQQESQGRLRRRAFSAAHRQVDM